MTVDYNTVFKRSIEDPNGFWGEIAESCHWFKRWDRVLDDSNKPFTGGLPEARSTRVIMPLDLHIDNDRGDQTALVYDSPVTDTIKEYSYRELRDQVAGFAGVLSSKGVSKGDRVLIYMPMIAETAIAVLACARIGAIHSVVFGGFAARELAVRIDDATPKVVVSASCGIEVARVIPYKPLLDEAIRISTHKPDACIIFQRSMEAADLISGRDIDWAEAMVAARPHECVPMAATDPAYILYTSGTTGVPKGVVRDIGGHIVALKWSMKGVYDVNPGDVYWAASDIGWVVGHSYIVYAPLFQGCTTVLFEGKPVGTPDAGVFWRVISDHKVKTLFTAPTAFRAIKREDPRGELIGNYDLSGFKSLFLAGERTDPDTLKWAEAKLGVPVIDHWWQTETGWAIASNCMGVERLKVKQGSPTKPVPGWNLQVVDTDTKPVAAGEIGALVVQLPLPPGSLPTLWKNDEGYKKTYLDEFPGYYKTADAGYIDAEGYVFVMSRTDDIINVAGHRLSTGGMEEVLSDHPDVAEAAVLGVDDSLKGQVPVGFLVLNAGVTRDHGEIVNEVIKMVRERIGPVAAFKTAAIVQRLPKTRSGKILRGTIRKIANNQEYKTPATIDDPAILEEMTDALIKIGYAAGKK